jgi:hypothetical protein
MSNHNTKTYKIIILQYKPCNIILIRNPLKEFIENYPKDIAVVGSSCWFWENIEYESNLDLIEILKQLNYSLYKEILQEPNMYQKTISDDTLFFYNN